MRSKLRNALVFAAVAAVLIGCSGKKEETTIVGADGSKTTVGKDGITYSNGDTSASIGAGASVSEGDLHMPFYPGSTEKPDATMKVEAATEKSYLTVRLTGDDVVKVKEFYEANVKGLRFNLFEGPDGTNAFASMKDAEGANLAVTVSRKKGASETEISLGYGTQGKK